MASRAALTGLAVYAGTAASAYLYFKSRHQDGGTDGSADDGGAAVDLASAVSRMAPDYDREIAMDEALMGLGALRWWVCRGLRGKVLEVSCGTGRNLTHYGDCATVVATDLSDRMLAVAAGKVDAGGVKTAVTFRQMDAEHLDFPDDTFDAVVDTFGLCSVKDPEAALREMQRVCKPDGQVVLLEHGKAHYDWLNGMLDDGAHKHAERWGCWWNRPIGEVVESSGLDVTSLWRFHFGTTYVYHGRPAKGSQPQGAAAAAAAANE